MDFNRGYFPHKFQQNVSKTKRPEDLMDENREKTWYHFGKAHKFGVRLAWPTVMTTYFKRDIKKTKKAKSKFQKNCKIFLVGQELKIKR